MSKPSNGSWKDTARSMGKGALMGALKLLAFIFFLASKMLEILLLAVNKRIQRWIMPNRK